MSQTNSNGIPWWLFAAVLVVSVGLLSTTVPEQFEALLVPWMALSLLFSTLPLLALWVYMLECKQKRTKPTLRGYCELLRVLKKAKQQAYHQTSRSLLPGDAPRIAFAVLVWMLVAFTAFAGNYSRLKGLMLKFLEP
jgi:hypothetical protein